MSPFLCRQRRTLPLGSPALVALPIWADVGLVAAADRTAGVVEAVGDQVVYAKAHMLPSVIGEG